jgi:hypothetical protein
MTKSQYWWNNSTERPIWIEITRRINDDIGIDLNHHGNPLAHKLLAEPQRGDRVIHWDSKRGAFVRVSTVADDAPHDKRDGRFRYLKDSIDLPAGVLTLENIREHWKAIKSSHDAVAHSTDKAYFPFAPYHGWHTLRPSLRYLNAAPQDLVSILGLIYSRHQNQYKWERNWSDYGFRPVKLSASVASTLKPKHDSNAYVRANELVTFDESGKPQLLSSGDLERAVRTHHALQNQLANWLKNYGITPESQRVMDKYPVDIQWNHQGALFVAEVKSLTKKNEAQQLRLALGQVLHYRYLAMTTKLDGKQDVVPVVVIPHQPNNDFSPEKGTTNWVEFFNNYGVLLVWPATFRKLLRQSQSR